MIFQTCGLWIFQPNGECLFCHQTKSPETEWSIPKGMREPRETIWEAAVRETHEETNININDFKFTSVRLPDSMYKNGHKILISWAIFLKDSFPSNYNLDCNVKINNFQKEIDEYKWMSLAIASPFLKASQQEVIKHFNI